MLKTKNGEPLNELTTNQFAEEILNNPNKVFCFLTKPDDGYCYFLASVNLFSTQTVIINAGRFIGSDIINVPGMSYAFSMYDYDVGMNLCCDRENCTADIINGLNEFRRLNPFLNNAKGKNGNKWYIVGDEKEDTLETIHHW